MSELLEQYAAVTHKLFAKLQIETAAEGVANPPTHPPQYTPPSSLLQSERPAGSLDDLRVFLLATCAMHSLVLRMWCLSFPGSLYALQVKTAASSEANSAAACMKSLVSLDEQLQDSIAKSTQLA